MYVTIILKELFLKHLLKQSFQSALTEQKPDNRQDDVGECITVKAISCHPAYTQTPSQSKHSPLTDLAGSNGRTTDAQAHIQCTYVHTDKYTDKCKLRS